MTLSHVSGRVDSLTVCYPDQDLDKWDRFVCTGLYIKSVESLPLEVTDAYIVTGVNHDGLSGRLHITVAPLPRARDLPTLFYAVDDCNTDRMPDHLIYLDDQRREYRPRRDK